MVLPWHWGWSPQQAAPTRSIGCPPRGMERRGLGAGHPRRQGAQPHRRPSSSRGSKVRAVHGKTSLTVSLLFSFVFFWFDVMPPGFSTSL